MPRVSGSSCLEEERVRRAVAGEDLVRGERLDRRRRHLLGLQLGPRLGDGPAAHQRLALRQAIGEEEFLMAAVVLLVGAGRDQEVARDDVGALVDELVEGVLAVGARLAEDDRPGRAHHRGALRA